MSKFIVVPWPAKTTTEKFARMCEEVLAQTNILPKKYFVNISMVDKVWGPPTHGYEDLRVFNLHEFTKEVIVLGDERAFVIWDNGVVNIFNSLDHFIKNHEITHECLTLEPILEVV